MHRWKKWVIALLIAAIWGSLGTGLSWHSQTYLMVDFKFYPRYAKTLDLRGEKLTISQYEALRAKLPDCEIQWNVPFQGSYYAQENKNLTISSLTAADVETLDYFPQLESIHAEDCTDYAQLMALQQRRPEIDVRYRITLGDRQYDPEETELVITGIAQSEISRLDFFSDLQKVILSGEGDPANFGELIQVCQNKDIPVQLQIGDTLVDTGASSIASDGVTDGELQLLQFLPELKQVHILNPKASAERLVSWQNSHPKVTLSWNQEVCGILFSNTDTEIDISGTQVEDLEALQQQMTYFPSAKKLIMSDCGVDNETMAQLREDHREDYQVVWTVQLGDKLTARTDDTTFMPTREKVYYFLDEESVNLKYCENMVCIDVGHMAIHNVDFAAFMPDLEYLILAHTEVRDISPLANCKKLKFLELDNSTVRDFTPLLECTALEDLNIGNTYPDLEPIAQMTWLKNLWMVGRGGGAYEVTQALTETNILLSGNATVAGGWRELPNYFAMRNLLGMPYMTW